METFTRRLAAIAFADVAGWSRLVEANELAALHAWNRLRGELIEPKIREHMGRLVDLAGDAVFVEFPSAINALNWALELQRHAHAEPAAQNTLALRIGVNVCDILVDEGRLVGDGVNIASRIHQLASPGEIVVTEAVREQVLQRLPVSFRDLGARALKNISRPIRVYRVEAPGLGIAAPREADAEPPAMRALLALDLPKPGPQAGPGSEASSLLALQAYATKQLGSAEGARLVGSPETGLLADFADARAAVQTAFAIQKAYAHAAVGAGTSLPRMGVQMGEAGAQSGAALAAGAGTATRLAALAGPGEIVASGAVRDELTAVLDAEIDDLGECPLEGLYQPVRAYRLGPPQPRPLPDAGADDEPLQPTIAVIPFSAHDQGYEPLGEILAEEVISALSRTADLNVVSRLSTTAFRGRAATLAEVSAHLHANYVLSGAYRVSAGALILAAELADAQTGSVVWAKHLKGSVSGIVEGHDEIVDQLVADASGALMTRELERMHSHSLHSLQTCTLLIGAIALMHRLSPHDFQRAHDMLQLVAQRAPRHAIPQAWLAKWHVLRVWQSWSPDPAADTRLAIEHSRRALDNDSHCSLALTMDGFVNINLLKAFDVAEERYELALRVNPNDSLAWLLLGMLHAFKGEGKQAIKGARHALRLSPLDMHRYFYDSLAGGAELAAGHYERAIELTQRSLRANRMHASTFRMLAISQWQLGRHAQARATVAELMKIEPSLRVGEWFQRSPSSEYPIGRLCADALRQAGVPE